MPRHSEERAAEFTRHVRRMERQERLRAMRPFALAGLAAAILLAAIAWNTFSVTPCGDVTGVVQAARSEPTPLGERHFLTVRGDDGHNYYSADPGDRAQPAGTPIVLQKSCSHTGAPRPLAHFDHWADESSTG